MLNVIKTITQITFLFFLILNISTVLGQKKIIIAGTIINAKTKSPVDSSVYITIKLGQKELYKVYCNQKGKYSINISDTLNGKTIVIHSSQDEKKINVEVKEEQCGYQCLENLEYISSAKREIITLKADSAEKYVVDFTLTPLLRCGSPPTIYFKLDELTMVQSDWYETSDSALCYIKGFMRCRPTMTIELSGNCSPSEKNKDTLSLKRAQIAKEKLVSLGINPRRIYVKGYSDRNYKEYKKQREEDAKFNGYYKSTRLIKYEGQVVYISQLSNDFGIPTKYEEDSEE